MRKFLVALGAATAALAGAVPANAATFLLNVNPSADSVDFGNSTSKYKYFYDFFSFTVPKGIVNAAISSFATKPWLNVTLTKVTFDGALLNQKKSGLTELWTLDDTLVEAGTHTFWVYGRTGSRGGSYTGNLNFSAVPEPAAWGLMIVGFGLVGASMRRRSKIAVSYS
jgi:hypothetical protein